MTFKLENSCIQKINLPNSEVELFIKREDLIHEFVSGNKFRKLKYNIQEAQNQNYNTLLTFGGAFSNHIAAVASAGKLFGLKTIGIIRGDELSDNFSNNQTLTFAKANGMNFKFVNRETYKNKTNSDFIKQLQNEFGEFYLIPEGGTNALAIKGCEEILDKETEIFEYICVAVGTGGTISGLINCSKHSQQILGFPALKGDFLHEDIVKFAKKSNWKLINDYHFGGYAKVSETYIQFLNQFYLDYNIPLDPVYTGKMMFGILDLIKNNFFQKGSKILAIHTGGLQGNAGMNMILEKKNSTKIAY